MIILVYITSSPYMMAFFTTKDCKKWNKKMKETCPELRLTFCAQGPEPYKFVLDRLDTRFFNHC